MPNNSDDWLSTQYFEFLTEGTTASLDYLHNTITWSLTITTGGVGLIVSQEGFPSQASLVFLLGLIVLLTHFLVRAAKAYLNVIRYTTLQRHIVATQCHLAGSLDRDELLARVHALHVQWRSPLQRRTVFTKLLAELGFGYAYLFLIAMTVFVFWRIKESPVDWLMVGVACTGAAFEIGYGLIASPYLRSLAVDSSAEEFR